MMSCSMRRRSSNEQNADCMPVVWIAPTSPHPKPFMDATACTSLDTVTPLMSRLSVLMVARMPSRWNSPTGWWVSPYHFGIDQGPVILMIENYRTGLIWSLMRRSPFIAKGLRRAGFTGGWLEG